MRHVPIVFTALLLLLAHPLALGAQTCPQNSFWAWHYGHAEESFTVPYVSSWGGWGYNLITGTFEATEFGGMQGETSSGMTLQDRYRIAGPASESPIPIQVRAHFSGVAEGAFVSLPDGRDLCAASNGLLVLFSGTNLQDAMVESQRGVPCASRTIDADLSLDLQKLPGEEFLVSVGVSLAATYGMRVTVDGTISFAGLPPGYSIQSCQGYTGAPVPVARRTWGAVKQLYR